MVLLLPTTSKMVHYLRDSLSPLVHCCMHFNHTVLPLNWKRASIFQVSFLRNKFTNNAGQLEIPTPCYTAFNSYAVSWCPFGPTGSQASLREILSFVKQTLTKQYSNKIAQTILQAVSDEASSNTPSTGINFPVQMPLSGNKAPPSLVSKVQAFGLTTLCHLVLCSQQGVRQLRVLLGMVQLVLWSFTATQHTPRVQHIVTGWVRMFTEHEKLEVHHVNI